MSQTLLEMAKDLVLAKENRTTLRKGRITKRSAQFVTGVYNLCK